MIGRRIPRELRPERRPGGLRRALRWLGIALGVVLVATAVVPAVGVLIAAVFWLLLAAVLTAAAAAAAGPVRRWSPVLAAGLATAAGWVARHCPPWLLAAAGVLGGLVRRPRPRVLVAAIAPPRVPLAALPPAPSDTSSDRAQPWGWAA